MKKGMEFGKLHRNKLEIKSVFCIHELPVTIEEIRNKAKIDKYTTEKKKQTIDQQYKKINEEKIFPSEGIFMYWWSYQECWKKNIKRLLY